MLVRLTWHIVNTLVILADQQNVPSYVDMHALNLMPAFPSSACCCHARQEQACNILLTKGTSTRSARQVRQQGNLSLVDLLIRIRTTWYLYFVHTKCELVLRTAFLALYSFPSHFPREICTVPKQPIPLGFLKMRSSLVRASLQPGTKGKQMGTKFRPGR